MNRSIWHRRAVTLLGIDLAWGNRNPDGIASLRFPQGVASPPEPIRVSLTHGNEALLQTISEQAQTEFVFIAIDAPTIGPNQTGSRPVDRECSRLFRREEAGCHPVNRQLCQRPLLIAEELRDHGFELSADLCRGPLLLAEVYPHPAMIRLFGIPRTIKYKRGPVAERRREFSRYQELTRKLIEKEFPALAFGNSPEDLLSTSWSKNIEDQLDAVFSCLIGWWHLRHLGEQSQHLGDEKTGAILLPKPLTPPLAET